MYVEEGHPLKQGLKQKVAIAYLLQSIVEEGHPLKQGLKQGYQAFQDWRVGVKEEHPLKQGLKLDPYSYPANPSLW